MTTVVFSEQSIEAIKMSISKPLSVLPPLDTENDIMTSTPTTTSSCTTPSDSRAGLTDDRIVYKNVHAFRVKQALMGVDTLTLTDTQWGLVALDKCHHISTTSTLTPGLSPSSPASPATPSPSSSQHVIQNYRVRICKTCCHEANHIELGTYMDQESAILVNDCHEILHNRYDKLIFLRPEDRPQFHLLTARKYDRLKGKDYSKILDLLGERSVGTTTPSVATANSTSASPPAAGSVESKKRKSPSVPSSSGSASGATTNDDTTAASALFSPAPALKAAKVNRSSTQASPHNGQEDDNGSLAASTGSGSRSSGRSKVRVSPSVNFQEQVVTRQISPPPSPMKSAPSSPMKISDVNASIAASSIDVPRSPSFMRQRSYTFSTAADFAPASFFPAKPIDPLAWLAAIAMEAEEADCAASLTGMKASSADSTANTLGAAEVKQDEPVSEVSEDEGEDEEAAPVPTSLPFNPNVSYLQAFSPTRKVRVTNHIYTLSIIIKLYHSI